jgi:uncharacterized protein YcfL
MVKKALTPLLIALTLISVLAGVSFAQVNLGVINTNTFLMNLGSGDGSLSMDFIDPTSGAVVDNVSDTLSPRIGKMVLASDLAVSDGWIGSAVVSSDQPTGAIVNMLFGNGTAAAYTGVSSPSPQVYLADLFRRTGRFSRIAIQNTESSQATVEVHYYDRNGTETIPTNPADRSFTIEAYRQVTIDLSDVNINFDTTLGIGSMFINSTSGHDLAASASLHWPTQSGAYSGVGTGDTTLWFPGCIRWPHTSPTQFSSMIVQNTGGSDAIVRFEILDRNNNVNFVFTDTVPSNVAYGFNFSNVGASMDTTTWNNMIAAVIAGGSGEAGWKGTVKAVSTNGQPLVGVGIFFSPTGDNIMFNAINNSDATTGDLAFPVSKRYLTGISNDQFTIHIIQNLANEAATVDVGIYDRNGVQLVNRQDITIPANGSVAFNLQKEIDLPLSDLNALGTNFSGSMYVTGDGVHPIIGIAYQYFRIAGKSMGYNAFVVP